MSNISRTVCLCKLLRCFDQFIPCFGRFCDPCRFKIFCVIQKDTGIEPPRNAVPVSVHTGFIFPCRKPGIVASQLFCHIIDLHQPVVLCTHFHIGIGKENVGHIRRLSAGAGQGQLLICAVPVINGVADFNACLLFKVSGYFIHSRPLNRWIRPIRLHPESQFRSPIGLAGIPGVLPAGAGVLAALSAS